MRDRINEAAKDSGRSMNTEIVSRLDQSLNMDLEVDNVWQEVHRRDAQIRALEEKLYEREKEQKEIQTRAMERDLYWTNISLALNGVRRANLIQFRASLKHILMSSDNFPPSLKSYAEDMLSVLNEKYDDLPETAEAMRFLVTQADDAHNLVYAAPDGELDPDFIIDPPKQK